MFNYPNMVNKTKWWIFIKTYFSKADEKTLLHLQFSPIHLSSHTSLEVRPCMRRVVLDVPSHASSVATRTSPSTRPARPDCEQIYISCTCLVHSNTGIADHSCAWNNQCEEDVMCLKLPMWRRCYVPETTNVKKMLCAWNNQCEYDVMCLKQPMWI